jgi:hypothetical protein
MSDEYREVTQTGFLSNLMGSFAKVVSGLIALVIAFPLLWFNEGCSVKTAKALEEGAGAVISVQAEQVDPSNQGKLIHVSGAASTDEVLVDSDLDLKVGAVSMQRSTEIYQWIETKETKEEKQTGGGTEKVTTYKYSKQWTSSPVNSSNFKKASEHENTGELQFPANSWQASVVKLGAFELNPNQISQIPGSQAVPLDSLKLPADLEGKAQITTTELYLGQDPSAPEIGDQRVKWTYVPSGQKISVVASQVGTTFEPYTTTNGESVSLLESGTVSANAMFQSAQDSNATKTWIFRAIGFLIMAGGFALLFSPIIALANVLPFIGNIAEFGAKMIGFLLGGIFSTLTIGLAWVFYRPLIGISILAVTVLLTVVLFLRKKKAVV